MLDAQPPPDHASSDHDSPSSGLSIDDGNTCDCFLSYNSADKQAARKLAEILRDRGLSVWLDEWCLRPGLPCLPLIEAGIQSCPSFVVLVGKDGFGPWQSEEMRAALSRAVGEKRTVIPVIPVLLADDAAAPKLPLFLAGRECVDLPPAGDADYACAIDRLVWGIRGDPPDQTTRGQERPPIHETHNGTKGPPLNPASRDLPPAGGGRRRR